MNLLRRALTFALALAPLVAQADACTVGAVAGRPDMACGMERMQPVVASAAESCPYCHAGSAAKPAPVRPRPEHLTCCDLKPEATADAGIALPGFPAGFEHPAVAPIVSAPEAAVATRIAPVPDVGRAPPGGFSTLLPSRAPPLG